MPAQHMFSTPRAWFLLSILIAAAPLAGNHGSKYNTTKPEHLEVYEKLSYSYTHCKYDPPVRVTVSEVLTRYDSPEDAAMSLMSAMAAADYASFYRGWTSEAQKTMSEEDNAKHHSPDYWTKQWTKWLRGRKVNMTDRVETGKYVIISMIAAPTQADAQEEPTEFPWVLVKDSKGRWLATEDLDADPVLLNWRRPSSAIERVIR